MTAPLVGDKAVGLPILEGRTIARLRPGAERTPAACHGSRRTRLRPRSGRRPAEMVPLSEVPDTFPRVAAVVRGGTTTGCHPAARGTSAPATRAGIVREKRPERGRRDRNEKESHEHLFAMMHEHVFDVKSGGNRPLEADSLQCAGERPRAKRTRLGDEPHSNGGRLQWHGTLQDERGGMGRERLAAATAGLVALCVSIAAAAAAPPSHPGRMQATTLAPSLALA